MAISAVTVNWTVELAIIGEEIPTLVGGVVSSIPFPELYKEVTSSWLNALLKIIKSSREPEKNDSVTAGSAAIPIHAALDEIEPIGIFAVADVLTNESFIYNCALHVLSVSFVTTAVIITKSSAGPSGKAGE